MTLDVVEGGEQTLAQFFRRVKVTVVRGLHSGVVPNPFDGIELRRVGRKQIDFQPSAVRAEPFVDFRLLVIGGVVLYQVDSVVAPVKTRQQGMLQEFDVRSGVEVLGLVAVGEPAVRNIDGSKKFLAAALSACRNLRLGVESGPCLVQGRRLAERRLVFVNDYGPFRSGFFLRLG